MAIYRYERDPQAIYRESFARIEAEAGPALTALPRDLARVAVRLIHACGMADLVEDLAATPDLVEASRKALAHGAPILCDAAMVASGIMRRHLPAGVEIVAAIELPGVKERAVEIGNTRSAAAMDLLGERLDGALVAIGNAPTALFRLLEMIELDGIRPAAILGFPVGFVGAAESKDALIAADLGIPYLTLRGRRGGSALAAAAVNALILPEGDAS
ncbi:precorrin-8X methylmutase [Hypericibacter sp.]|uniref:precorrin-8X methylmutase n=1 Tax=Hypericibacter sp. TaxID=2705401 RepID=UPI003D6D6F7F